MIDIVFLVFVACLAPDSGCREVNGGQFRSVASCVAASLTTVAEWMGNHPDYSVAMTVTCGPEPADEGDEI